MIKFTHFSLDNGLRIIVHEDRSTPLVAMNILYIAGSRDEDPDHTGLAHLFEHLMFGGSVNIPEYDIPLQLAGGENNAFTNNDITGYYLTVPSENIETGFWLESDRMLELNFSQENLDIQKNVVIEEFKQRYLNQPYGDAMLKLRPLAYKVHPYRWPTIGMDISHIEKTDLSQVKDFFFTHYAPNNAIITLTGRITPALAYDLSVKWFGPIDKRAANKRELPVEPAQTEERILSLEKDVSSNALYKAWHVGPRTGENFHTVDLITDILAGGESGRLYTKLVREKNLFNEINAYTTADIDPGLVVITGKLMKGIDPLFADKAINEVINNLKNRAVGVYELNKVKNKFESSMVLSNTSVLNKAMSLSYYELLGDADIINNEIDFYRAVTTEMILETAQKYLIPSNCSTLFYNSTRND